MNKILFLMLSAIAIFVCGYFCGSAHSKVKIVEKKVEVIKYEAQKRAAIQAEPNASRDDLLKLMRNGEL